MALTRRENISGFYFLFVTPLEAVFAISSTKLSGVLKGQPSNPKDGKFQVRALCSSLHGRGCFSVAGVKEIE